MSVRAKLNVDAIETTLYRKQKDPSKGWADDNIEVEMKTIKMSPVGYNSDNNENSKFWDASPMGKLELGTINPEASKQFKLGKEYYLDFTEAG